VRFGVLFESPQKWLDTKVLTYSLYDTTNKKQETLEDSLSCFEGLNSSLAQSTGKLWSCKMTRFTGKSTQQHGIK